MDELEKEAYMYGAQMGSEYLKEIGKTDLALMNGQEVLTFSECMCKNYAEKLAELEDTIPF